LWRLPEAAAAVVALVLMVQAAVAVVV